MRRFLRKRIEFIRKWCYNQNGMRVKKTDLQVGESKDRGVIKCRI